MDAHDWKMKAPVRPPWNAGGHHHEHACFTAEEVTYMNGCMHAWYKPHFFVPMEWSNRHCNSNSRIRSKDIAVGARTL